MKPLVALIGCGRWGLNILRDLISLECKVVVVDPSIHSREASPKMGALAAVESLDEVGSIDGAIVATPTCYHAEVIKQLLPLNIPVFVEKPLTTDIKEALYLASIAKNKLFVMDKWRYHPGVEALAQIVHSGILGSLLGISLKRVGWGNSQDDIDCVWTLAPHDLSIVLEILGYIPPPRTASSEKDGDSFISMTGFLGEKPWVIFEVSARSAKKQRLVRIHCEKGIASLYDFDDARIQLLMESTDSSESEERWLPISSEQPLLRELKAFLSYLKGGPCPKSSALDGAKIVETIAELRRF
ncbi:MAG: Gfo/Idh/MocA family oxidoreductase [Parachlamydiaceae bacterium]